MTKKIKEKKYCKKCGKKLIEVVYNTNYDEFTGNKTESKALACNYLLDSDLELPAISNLTSIVTGHTLDYIS